MRRLLTFILFLATSDAVAAVRYVDPGCTKAEGNGSSASCLTSPTTNNPYHTLDAAVTAMNAGDTLRARGVHGAHDSNNCPGTDGRYSTSTHGVAANGILVIPSKAYGSETIFEANGWSAIGANTQEPVFLETVETPTWTQCVLSGTCQAPCTGISAGVCTQVYYTGSTGNHSPPEMAQKANGELTYCVSDSSACGSNCVAGDDCRSKLSNAHSGYNANRCSPTQTWRPCPNGNSDCVGADTCVGTSAEIDSYSDGTTIWVRWNGATGNVTMTSNFASPILIENSTHVTVRGFIARAFRNAGAYVSGSSNILIRDNVFVHSFGAQRSGGEYGVWPFQNDSVTVDSNEFMWSAVEAIHTTAKGSGVTVVTLTNNHIHKIGDKAGEVSNVESTAQGMTLGDCGGGACGTPDFTGSVVSGSLIYDITARNNNANGLNFEGQNNTTVRDNIFLRTNAACAFINTSSNGYVPSGNVFYNNLCIQPGTGGGGNGGFEIGSGTNADGLVFYNNTSVSDALAGLWLNSGSAPTNALIRNNVFYSSGNHKILEWPDTGATNVFQNNLVYSATKAATDTTLTNWKGTGYSCNTIASLDATDKCSDPVFVNSSTDLHIQTSSPAKNSGTATGMPAGRTTDINNTLASSHGLVSYADATTIQGGTWDMGVDEFTTSGSSRRPMVVTGLRRAFATPPVVGPAALLSCP